jgi:hypothetical protein
MTGAAGVSSLYTVRPPAPAVENRLLIRVVQAFLGTAILMKWHKIETRKTIRIREALMAAMAIFLLVSAIMYVRFPQQDTPGLTGLCAVHPLSSSPVPPAPRPRVCRRA